MRFAGRLREVKPFLYALQASLEDLDLCPDRLQDSGRILVRLQEFIDKDRDGGNGDECAGWIHILSERDPVWVVATARVSRRLQDAVTTDRVWCATGGSCRVANGEEQGTR